MCLTAEKPAWSPRPQGEAWLSAMAALPSVVQSRPGGAGAVQLRATHRGTGC